MAKKNESTLIRHLFSRMFVLCASFLFAIPIHAQELNDTQARKTLELGLPYIQNYTAEEYNAGIDNWSAVQDSLGLMYFANGHGILTYDGANWGGIELPNLGSALALAKDKTGKIWVGGANELGYLSSNSKGELSYVSLRPELSKIYKNLDKIRKIYVAEDGIYFGSLTSFFKWDGNNFKIWEMEERSWIFYANRTIYVKIAGQGLMALKNDKLELIPDGDRFKDSKVTTITSYDKDRLLISTFTSLYLYDGKSFSLFPIDAPDFFDGNRIYSVLHLNDRTIAIGSYGKGILFVDRKGQKITIITKKEILNSNLVTFLYQDNTGNIWATLFSGLAKIEFPSPFSIFNKHNNTPNIVFDFQRYKEKLFVATAEGLFFLDAKDPNDNALFTKLPSYPSSVIRELIIFKNRLLVAGHGIYQLDENGRMTLLSEERTQYLYKSKIDTNRLYIGLNPGLSSFYFKNGKLSKENTINGINTRPVRILEDSKGTLWVTTDENEVISVSFVNLDAAKRREDPVVQTYSTEKGLPNNIGYLYCIDDKVYFKSDNEIYQFDYVSKRFKLDQDLFRKLGLEETTVKINWVDQEGNIYLIEYEEDKRVDQIIAFKVKDGKYQIKRIGEGRIINARKYTPYPELADSIIWYIGKPTGIVRHDLSNHSYSNEAGTRAHISAVIWRSDSIVFGGSKTAVIPRLPFKNNQLRFKFSSPSFYDESKNQFQYQLEGFDEDWSSWSLETQKDYTNLPEGDYRFKVRSKNIYNHIGIEDSYAFTILAPWYRAWWAYTFYTSLILGFLYLLYRFQLNRKLAKVEARRLKEKQILEAFIEGEEKERKRVARELHDGLGAMLATVKMQINSIGNIFPNVSSISTYQKAESLIDEACQTVREISHEMMPQILEQQGLKIAVDDFCRTLSNNKDIAFNFYYHGDEHLLGNTHKITIFRIIQELLKNIIQHAQAKEVIVQLTIEENEVFLIVEDNGIGFDTSKTPNGIGISNIRSRVAYLKGSMEIDSTIREGSTFTIQLPLNKDKNVATQ